MALTEPTLPGLPVWREPEPDPLPGIFTPREPQAPTWTGERAGADASRRAAEAAQDQPMTWRDAREIAQRNGYSLAKTEGGDYRLAPTNLAGEPQEARAYYATEPGDAIGTMRADMKWQADHSRKVDRLADLLNAPATASTQPQDQPTRRETGRER